MNPDSTFAQFLHHGHHVFLELTAAGAAFSGRATIQRRGQLLVQLVQTGHSSFSAMHARLERDARRWVDTVAPPLHLLVMH